MNLQKNTELNKWDIWIADVAFEDDITKSKLRPVLIIDNQKAIILTVKMTSQPPRINYYAEYQIQEWQKAGLNKPTVVRISKIIKLSPTLFKKKIGVLHYKDRKKVTQYLENNDWKEVL